MRVSHTAVAITAVMLTLVGSGHPAAAATDAQYSACRDRVLQAFPGLPASEISLNQGWESNGSVRLDWTAARAGAGLCVIGPRNQVLQFVNDQAPWPPGNGNRPMPPGGNQSFGDIPGLGQFVVVNGSGRSQGNGSVNFEAYVNGRGPSTWTADCPSGRLHQGGGYVTDSSQARYAVSYICSGGSPPQPVQPGTVNFGNVPGIGQFAVVNGSGTSAFNGAVNFQAYVNGYGPSEWTAQCNTGQLLSGPAQVPASAQSQYVVSYICNGGEPRPQPGAPQGSVNFGNLPGVGQFVVINNSGSRNPSAPGFVAFEAFVNGAGPQRWVADCGRVDVQRGGNYAPPSSQSRYVASYICTGGRPQQFESGTVNFGFVPGVGQVAVVNGSGSANTGVVNFLAYVDGAGPSQWIANCGTGQLGRNGSYVPYSAQAQYVASYICNGGPPGPGWGR